MNLRILRAKRGWSQEDLALESGLHRTFVAHVEREAKNISIDNLEKLAKALEVPVHCILKNGSHVAPAIPSHATVTRNSLAIVQQVVAGELCWFAMSC